MANRRLNRSKCGSVWKLGRGRSLYSREDSPRVKEIPVFKSAMRTIAPLWLCSTFMSGILASAQVDTQSKAAPAAEATSAATGDTEALAKAAQNPVASLISET
jgi:hypothetical protein